MVPWQLIFFFMLDEKRSFKVHDNSVIFMCILILVMLKLLSRSQRSLKKMIFSCLNELMLCFILVHNRKSCLSDKIISSLTICAEGFHNTEDTEGEWLSCMSNSQKVAEKVTHKKSELKSYPQGSFQAMIFSILIYYGPSIYEGNLWVWALDFMKGFCVFYCNIFDSFWVMSHTEL